MPSQNFGFLKHHDPLFLKLAEDAERLFVADPSACVMKLRQLGEAFAKEAAASVGVYAGPEVPQVDVLRALEQQRIAFGKTAQLFHQLRRVGNRVAHDVFDQHRVASHQVALDQLRVARHLAIWFHRTFGGIPSKTFRPGPFVAPEDPTAQQRQLEEEASGLRATLAESQQAAALARELRDVEAKARAEAERVARALAEERDVALKLAEEMEAALAEQRRQFEEHLEALQREGEQKSEQEQAAAYGKAVAAEAALDLSEEDTRLLIDDALAEQGWEVDSKRLTYAKGARPQKGKNLAIAEWPTSSGPADYVLFVGLVPLAVVEAKKKAKNVPGVIEQAKRYSRDLQLSPDLQLPRPVGAPEGFPGWPTTSAGTQHYRVPFLFATNGRPYLKQLETESGIWFLDARSPKNHARALVGWYTPHGLVQLLEQDTSLADQKLKEEPTEYLGLRDYQLKAIHFAEQAIESGKRRVLLAMATGTGKTRTVIGLLYRLLKAGRFRRVLFLVDRSALGEQAQNAFKEMRLEQSQPFSEIFEVKELSDLQADPSTRVHVATVQAMVRRAVLAAPEDRLPVDEYDLIVVDEAHRGYNLDAEMGEGELELRSHADYISLYRRVLEHFDAVAVGLTATPALETKEIFGKPVYVYSYPEAVIDGWLIDHEPPIRLMTKLAEEGIHLDAGDEVKVLRPGGQQELWELPDELDFQVAEFNRKVIAPEFTRVICEQLAERLDPEGPEKTLIFCVNDAHADRVVASLKKALDEKWGGVDDEAVKKITGATDRYLEAIRYFKNENLPTIAVTVDLLTTGIDVPAITSLVFLRRVRSRILYEQMIGRATRRCDKIGKEVFHIYDAVGLYDALEDVTDMKPVVQRPNVGVEVLVSDLLDPRAHELEGSRPGTTYAEDALAELTARLQRRARRAAKLEAPPQAFLDAAQQLSDLTGVDLADFASLLAKMSAAEAKAFFEEKPLVLPAIQETFAALKGLGQKAVLSDAPDEALPERVGYGEGNERPEDYLAAFQRFVTENQNQIAALNVVLTRPRELTREQLKELRTRLHEHGYTEASIRSAWRKAKNQDIAASIIGFIRQMALGSPLVPYEQRVDKALQKVLALEVWSKPQQKWLQRIAEQLKREVVVDAEAFSAGAFKSHGGYARVDKDLGGKLAQVLDAFGDGIWEDVA